MIIVESRRKSKKTLEKKYPGAMILDVTSKGIQPWIQLSPFYPHGGIPVPFSSSYTSKSVEGIWQGLKVFQQQDIDTSKFLVSNMKGLKRTIRKFGKPLGHRKGVNGTEMLDYTSARRDIYLPSYLWVLENKVQETLQLLKNECQRKNIILLDYTTNGNLLDERKPLSHAALIKEYFENKYPTLCAKNFSETSKNKMSRKSRTLKFTNEKETIARKKNKAPDKKENTETNQLNMF